MTRNIATQCPPVAVHAYGSADVCAGVAVRKAGVNRPSGVSGHDDLSGVVLNGLDLNDLGLLLGLMQPSSALR